MTDPNASQKHSADSSATDSATSDSGTTDSGTAVADVEQWTRRLTQALQILDLRVDHEMLSALAARSSASVGPTSAPITAFVVGYAAGLTAAAGSVTANEATRRAAEVALLLCAEAHPATPPRNGSSNPPDADGWLSTAQ